MDSTTLALAIQPPVRARPGVALYPPVAARLSSQADIIGQLSQIWAVATLVDRQSGEIDDDKLDGRVSDSAHPLAQDTQRSSVAVEDRAYFCFPDLIIHKPGRYRIRVNLMQMDYSSNSFPDGIARVIEYVDSHSISVEHGATDCSKPNAQERAFLRLLKHDGQRIS
ncbi:Uncharacterized protein BP5553_10393 [Venustampulla echinocandica]|uniref:Velvet domain-containing protein n=1 Tax=Venustampulla echinocandica TaxID=2656787 RepID=A0A370T967_9HELO|nr:Uncharacterized protein BP5553_10393 [Venustampulla echinocandica]RDL30115.1 Uncharacterized protein BP5553_10393 [Venustampulla echinocandica]